MKYKSQYKQDQFLYENFFKNVTDGFFIDIGASEHEYQNNTFFFEDLGWNGILIEPRKQELENLKNKRKSPVENVAIYKESGIFKFLSCDGYIKGLSGLLCEQKPEHLSRIFNELLIHGKSVEIIEVQTITFQDIIKKYQCNKIDYLSLDVEGAEHEVFKNFPFHIYKFMSMTIERPPKKLNNLLFKNGYKFVKNYKVDGFYIHKSFKNYENMKFEKFFQIGKKKW